MSLALASRVKNVDDNSSALRFACMKKEDNGKMEQKDLQVYLVNVGFHLM